MSIGREYRILARLARWQIVRVNIRQSVMEHSFSVALIADRLREHLGLPVDPHRLMKAGLLHDLDEIVQGDTASPAKTPWGSVPEAKFRQKEWLAEMMSQRFPWYEEETDADIREIIGMCDFAESIVALIEEERAGNMEVAMVLRDCSERFWLGVKEIQEKRRNFYGTQLVRFFSDMFAEHQGKYDRPVTRYDPSIRDRVSQ